MVVFLVTLAISIAGISNDHIDAAIITPDANPNKIFFYFLTHLIFIKNTIAEPKAVPKNGINRPVTKFIFIPPFFILYYHIDL